MNSFLSFITNKTHWLLLLIFEAIALSLLFNGSLYHKFLNATFTNKAMGMVHMVSGEVKSYLHLREKNRLLTEQLARAELNYLQLKQQVEFSQADTITPFIGLSDSVLAIDPIRFTTAGVISATVNRRRNIVVLDKGRIDGIKEQMGVVAASGVVGIISSVSDKYSIMVPLLNPDLRLSCTITRTGYTGTLWWNEPGDSFVTLSELSRHALYQKGDTVVTSGYSSVFPPGLFVGTIEENKKQTDQVIATKGEVNVKLGANFDNLQFVYIITGGLVLRASELDSIVNQHNKG